MRSSSTLPVKFVAIDGHGGSGKSSLASRLGAKLGAEVIHIDDFTGQGSKSDWYKRIIDLVIMPIEMRQSTISYPRAKWWPEHNPEPVVDQGVTPLMIIEGVGSSRRELRTFLSFTIFVDTPRDICIARGLERDRGMGGKSDEEIIALWEQWLKWDDEYFDHDQPQSHADINISGEAPLDKSVETIKGILLDKGIIRPERQP